ncbi:MAG TPA: hypothetical protein VFM55_20790 [Micromonosporaceae bacterium]|nr:hypothetical protein [Micromonosporaceae bacterium]
MVADLLKALHEGDPQPLRTWLAEIGIDLEAVRKLPRWNVTSGEQASATQRRGPGDLAGRLDEVLAGSLSRARRRPYGIALLFIYIYYECDSSWEVSYHYRPIWATLRAAYEHWQTVRGDVDSAERQMTDATVALLEVLDQEIQTENAMTSGRLGGFALAAETAAGHAGRALQLASAVTPTEPGISSYVTDRASLAVAYYEAVAEAGHALRRFFSEPGHSLDVAITKLAAAEVNPVVSDLRSSELRSHRFALQALQTSAGSTWLHIDSGKVTYIYPFAVRRADPGAIVARASAEAKAWDLCGLTPSDVHDTFDLDDLWDGSDFLGRRFDGTRVELPQLAVYDLAGKLLAALDAAVYLSRLGNHFVRIEGALCDVNPADVYAAMFRAAPEHGTARVCAGDAGAEWPRLSAFAVDMAESVGANLGDLPISTRPGMFHVIVSVHSASTSIGPVGPRTEVQTREQLVAAAGAQVLVNPVTHCIASLAEWVRYPMPERTNILETVTMRDDLAVRTANTTLLVTLGSPSYHSATRQTVAEFVASLDGLFAGWGDDLATYYDRVNEQIPAITGALLEDASTTSEELGRVAAGLEQEQVEMHDFAVDVRSTVALIESPGLVASPVVASTVTGLLDAAGYRQRTDDLYRRMDAVLDERLGRRIDALVRRLAEREAEAAAAAERRQRARLDTALAVIAAVGVSGIAQIIQSGFSLREIGSLWITGIVLALALVVGLVAWASSTRGGAGAARATRLREHAGKTEQGSRAAPPPARTPLVP